MNRLLRIMLAIVVAVPVGTRAQQITYENPFFGIVTTPPVVDALNFVNYGQFNIFTLLPFETFDTLNYTNQGTMIGSTGFRFERQVNATGRREMAANFVNANPGVIEAVDYFPPIGFGLPCFPTVVEPSHLLIAATNIITGAGAPAGGAALTVGANGQMQLIGENVDVSHSGLQVRPIWTESEFGTAVNPDLSLFAPDIAIFDGYWVQTNFTRTYPMRSAAVWNGVFASSQSVPLPPSAPIPTQGFTLFGPYADSYVNFENVGILQLTNYVGSPTNVTGTNIIQVLVASNIFKGAVFVDVPPEFDVAIGFIPSSIANNPYNSANVRLATTISNAVTGLDDTAYLRIGDILAATEFRGLSLNVVGCTASTFRPKNFFMDRLDPFARFIPFGTAGNNGYPDPGFFVSSGLALGNTNAGFDGVTNSVVIEGEFSGYGAYVDNLVSRPPEVAGGSETNNPGRVRIIADNLDLRDARIRAEGELQLNASHLASSAGTVIDCENISINMSSTSGKLVVENLVPSEVQRLRGPVYFWSAVWTNSAVLVWTNNFTFTNVPIVDPPGSTNVIGTNVWAIQENVTNSITCGMSVTMINGSQLLTRLPVNVFAMDSQSTDTVIEDDLTVVRSMEIKGRSLTLNGDVTFPGSYAINPVTLTFGGLFFPRTGIQTWSKLNGPNLLYFTNNGTFTIPDVANFGADRSSSYSTFINNGTIQAASISLNSAYFENGGVLSSGGGIFIEGGTGKLEGGTSTSGNVTSMKAMNLKFNRYQINAPGRLLLDVTSSLSDAGAGSGNAFRLSDGVSLLQKPVSGDLLGTTITLLTPQTLSASVSSYWAAADRGDSAAGFHDNTALGTLQLSPQAGRSTFNIAGTGSANAMYVDLLDVSALTNLATQLRIAPNLTLYYAAARISDPNQVNSDGTLLQPEEYLDGQLGGRLRWVKTYAGAQSTQVLLVNGSPYPVNRALANSRIIDSDGDGVPNFFDIADPLSVIPLQVSITGNGTVTPNYSGSLLILGQTYTIIATPVNGSQFIGWSGSIASASPSLTFVAQSNLNLVANFTYSPVAASYNGLFYESTGIQFGKSGAISAKTSASGSYSGTIEIAGKRHAFRGQMDSAGRGTNTIPRTGDSTLTLTLQVGGQRIVGKVEATGWSADAVAERAVFSSANATPAAGKYTLAIPGSGDIPTTAEPFGHGFGTANVASSGTVQFSGSLADGTKISRGTALSSSGQWPLYSSLYSGKGQLLGWMTIAAVADRDIGGSLNWIKQPGASATYYSGGFDLDTFSFGSAYNPALKPVTGFTPGNVELSGGGISPSLENGVSISTGNKVTSLGPNKFSMSIAGSTGKVSGSMADPNSGRSLKFNGVILQKQGTGAGYFLNNGQSGRMTIESED